MGHLLFMLSLLRCSDQPSLQGDQRLAHDSGNEVTVEQLRELGVYHHRIPDLDGVNQLATERGYKNRDEIVVSPEKMGDIYEDKVKSFFHEHLHEDEEIRYVRDGCGYFDVRSTGDEWVRIRVEKVIAVSLVSLFSDQAQLTVPCYRTTSSSCPLAFTTDLRPTSPM